MRALTAEELVGTKWAGGLCGTGLVIAGIEQDGRFRVVFASGLQGRLLMSEITALGYWRIAGSLAELADNMTKRGSEHFVAGKPGVYDPMQINGGISLELGTVERYIQTGEVPVVGQPLAEELLAHVAHDAMLAKRAKCEPTCTPAEPCYAVKVCPAWKEEECTLSDWADEQHSLLKLYWWRGVEMPTAGEPRVPELRCARDWGCGLVRTR